MICRALGRVDVGKETDAGLVDANQILPARSSITNEAMFGEVGRR